MRSGDHVSELIRDFVFRDRRIADQPELRASVFLAEGDLLRRVATSVDGSSRTPDLTYRVGQGLTEKVFSQPGFAIAPDIPAATREPGDEAIRSSVACPMVVGGRAVGVVNLDSQAKLEFASTDIPRIQVLSALVAYEMLHLQQRAKAPSQLSRELGLVLRSARVEIGVTQQDLAGLVGTSRIALSRWEAGSQPPTRGPLRRWAAALGLLAGGRSEIITVVDATSKLVEVLRDDPQRLSQLSPEQFELLVAERLDRMGYAVQRTGSTNLKDGGIDIIAVPKVEDLRFLLAVQVKHHRGDRPTGRDAVDRLLAWQNTAFRLGMLVTNTRFTRDAVWTATQDPARHYLRLRDFADLTRWLQGVFSSEQDWREIPDSIELAPGVVVRIPRPQFTEAGIVWPLRNAFDEDA